ncbi:MAG: hypothetical protein OXM60_05665 [Defluviicoccus sp.]|nr:hypothetical protein [Defluviicoccus sp.]
MSETISSGGFSSASAYCRNWLNAASRSARRPLYSQAKQPRFHTSAQPSPPASFRAPRSKQYHSPAGSASAGVGSPSSRHRSMKCSCDAERSFNSDARHLAMKSPGVTVSNPHAVGDADETIDHAVPSGSSGNASCFHPVRVNMQPPGESDKHGAGLRSIITDATAKRPASNRSRRPGRCAKCERAVHRTLHRR